MGKLAATTRHSRFGGQEMPALLLFGVGFLHADPRISSSPLLKPNLGVECVQPQFGDAATKKAGFSVND